MGDKLLVADFKLFLFEFEVPDIGKKLLERFVMGALFHQHCIWKLVFKTSNILLFADNDVVEVLEPFEHSDILNDLRIKNKDSLRGFVEGGKDAKKFIGV